MKKKMQEDIIRALKIIKQVDMLENGKLPNEYKGYISSYGAAVGQSGLLPATMFFSEKPANNPKLSDTKLRRTKLMRAIHAVLKKKEQADTDAHVLLNHAKMVYSDTQEVRKILNAAVALKMAMRAFASDDAVVDNV